MKMKFLRIMTTALGLMLLAVVGFTVVVNVMVELYARPRTFTSADVTPYNKVGLLLGTSPTTASGRPNLYFTTRIKAAARLYHAGKISYILATGDNGSRFYDEATAMKNALIAQGVPADRIILDYAGFRTLDSVVRAKEVFGCKSFTIISQADHCGRALYLARGAGVDAVAFAAPLNPRLKIKVKMALREWMARDKMMLDLWGGKQPKFLGKPVVIPDVK